MTRIIKFIFALFLSLPGLTFAKSEKVPADFKIIYQSNAGAAEYSTRERIEVKGLEVTRELKARPVSPGSPTPPERESFAVSPENLQTLYALVVDSGFMEWPTSTELSRQSQGDETFEITLKGKTVTHRSWESAILEKFRILSVQFRNWLRDVRNPPL